jgi:hypothetical protein
MVEERQEIEVENERFEDVELIEDISILIDQSLDSLMRNSLKIFNKLINERTVNSNVLDVSNNITKYILNPYFQILPNLVEIYGSDNEILKKIVIQLNYISLALIERNNFLVKLDTSNKNFLTKLSFRISKITFKSDDFYIKKYKELSYKMGIWIAFADDETLVELAKKNPVQLLNSIVEYKSYIESFNYKIKLGSQDLNIIKHFFSN